jgi:hypothetical protein
MLKFTEQLKQLQIVDPDRHTKNHGADEKDLAII